MPAYSYGFAMQAVYQAGFEAAMREYKGNTKSHAAEVYARESAANLRLKTRQDVTRAREIADELQPGHCHVVEWFPGHLYHIPLGIAHLVVNLR
jgi:hypothetical protein